MLLPLALLMYLAARASTGDGAKTSTHLSFYLHDTITAPPGSPATAVRVTRGTMPLPEIPTLHFGDMYVIDDPLTEGPDPASPAVGRAQGFYLFASRMELALMFSFNVVFTSGPHNGSTVAVVARDRIQDEVRELPVVGGTSAFRGVTGHALVRTHVFNHTDLNAVLKIDMYLRVE